MYTGEYKQTLKLIITAQYSSHLSHVQKEELAPFLGYLWPTSQRKQQQLERQGEAVRTEQEAQLHTPLRNNVPTALLLVKCTVYTPLACPPTNTILLFS